MGTELSQCQLRGYLTTVRFVISNNFRSQRY